MTIRSTGRSIHLVSSSLASGTITGSDDICSWIIKSLYQGRPTR